MNKLRLAICLSVVCVFLLSACNGDGNDATQIERGMQQNVGNDASTEEAKQSDVPPQLQDNHSEASSQSGESVPGKGIATASEPTSERMVIYNADMAITVNQLKETQANIQSFVADADGYIVQSSVSDQENESRTGTMKVRVPEPKFRSFLDQIESLAADVKERNVHGRDVTKQYVDLESRLQAKKTVKKRLDSFLQEADDSEDLLNISNQLADVQEDIEEIKGEMQYLENHTALATVTIHITEESANIKQQKDLNTWGKTKQAFIDSINAIVTFFSAAVIVLFGYSPILVPLILIAVIAFLFYKKKRTPGE